MNLKLISCTLATAASVWFAGADATDPSMNATTNDLLGTWGCVSAIVDGRTLPAETTSQLRLTLTGDRYKTTKGQEVLFDSTYALNASTDPKQINMVGTEGELAGKEAQGIYAVKGDELRICYRMPGLGRPGSFDSAAGSKSYLVVWKRERVNRKVKG